MPMMDLSKYGITNVQEVIYNPTYEVLFNEETKPGLTGYDVGVETELGAINVMTGIYTGRSPKDKFIVYDDTTKEGAPGEIWWTTDEYKNDNKKCSVESWKALKKLAIEELSGKRLFVVDGFCGTHKDTRMKIRFIMEVAWQAHFVTNMFIRPKTQEEFDQEPDFVVFNASKAKVTNWKELGLNSETATVFNITDKEQVILNTWYGGEMKKGLFSMMNYFLPLKGIAAMHCSANTDMNGENTAIFFGLSGTGKTTLSTDPKRLLIGDDEHGWDDTGVFNFEGGCYAKVINLDPVAEPDIYGAIHRDALLENVTVDKDGKIDFADKSVTENTRVSYPIYHIKNIVRPDSHGPAAQSVIFLSADAFGVLPPVSIAVSLRSWRAPSAVSPSRPRLSARASVKRSLNSTRLNTPKNSLSVWKNPARRLISSTRAGTAPASAFPLRIRAALSTLSWAARLKMLRLRKSLSSTSKSRLNLKASRLISSTRATPTPTRPNGIKRRKIWQAVSLRTLRNTNTMRQVKHSSPQVRTSTNNF